MPEMVFIFLPPSSCQPSDDRMSTARQGLGFLASSKMSRTIIGRPEFTRPLLGWMPSFSERCEHADSEPKSTVP